MIAAVTLERHREGLHISASALRTLHECLREWWYRYVEGAAREDVPAAMVLGTALHKALAFYYRSLQEGDEASFEDLLGVANLSILKDVASTPGVLFRDGEDAETTVNEAKRLLDAFMEQGFRPAKVVAVEVPFGLPVVHPTTGEIMPYEERIIGAIDLIAEDGGEVVVVDHKTAAKPACGPAACGSCAVAARFPSSMTAGSSIRARNDALEQARHPSAHASWC